MAAWNDLTPVGDEAANTIHTLIQTAKVDIMERMRVTNTGAVDEHLVFDAGATGRHPLSKVDFACIYTDLTVYIAARTNPFVKPGTLHYDKALNKLYVGRVVKPGSTDPLDYIELISTTDHGQYTGLDEDDHTQYLLEDGSRVMTGNLTIDAAGVLTVTTIEVADDQPIHSDHAALTWYNAHGTNAIEGTMIAAGSLYTLNTDSIATGGTLDFCLRAKTLGGAFALSFKYTGFEGYVPMQSLAGNLAGTIPILKTSLATESE